MELKPGYKQTEVGVIPEDWDIRSLKDLCKEEITYGIVQCGPHVPGGIPYIRVSDMDGPILDREKMLCTSYQIASRFRRSEVRHGEIVYALRGRLGDVRPVPLDLDGANLTQGTARLSPSSRVHSPFLLWALRNPEVVLRACAESKGTTFMEITLADLRQIKIALPPEPEQLRIASTLSDIEDHLMALDRELAKKRNIKQAAMQELLTGKRRLPGFEGEWAEVSLGSVAAMNSGGTPPTGRDDFYGGGIQWVSISDMTSSGRFISETERTLSDLGLANCAAKRFPAGTILYAMYASLGECSMAAREVTTSQAILGIRPGPSLVGKYLYYWLESIRGAVKLMGQQGTQSNLNKKIVQGFSLVLPSKPEQAAIAKALGEIDQDIDALKDKAEKIRAMKAGMMQQLLTGKIRLT